MLEHGGNQRESVGKSTELRPGKGTSYWERGAEGLTLFTHLAGERFRSRVRGSSLFFFAAAFATNLWHEPAA